MLSVSFLLCVLVTWCLGVEKEDSVTYWIVVGSEEKMLIAEARGFDIFGFKSTRRAEVSRMQPGDKLIFYLPTGRQASRRS